MKVVKGKWVFTPRKTHHGYVFEIYHKDFHTSYEYVKADDVDKRMKELAEDKSIFDIDVYGPMLVDFEPEIDEKGNLIDEN